MLDIMKIIRLKTYLVLDDVYVISSEYFRHPCYRLKQNPGAVNIVFVALLS